MEQDRFRKASANANRVAFFLSGRLLSLLESLRRGQKRSICEDCQKTGFLSEKLTWGNVGRSASERLLSGSGTHISAFFVPRTSFSEKKGEKKAGRQFWLWSLISHEPGRAFFLWRVTVSLMALDGLQVGKPHALLLEKKVSGEKACQGVALLLRGVLLQVVGVILLEISIEQSHGVSHAWLLANMLGVKKSHVAHRFRGREGHEGEAVCRHGCVFER